jgi:hypothetical protein
MMLEYRRSVEWRDVPNIIVSALGGTIVEKVIEVNKYTISLIALATVMVVAVVLVPKDNFEKWAKSAPLESVTVSTGDTAWSLLQERIPGVAVSTVDTGFLLDLVEERTGKNLGNLQPGEEILLPIEYAEWQH